MINVSNEYKNIIKDSREFKTKVEITLENGTILNFDNDSIMSGGLTFNDATSDESSLSIGSAIINSTTIKLNNFNGQLDNYDFINATVVVEVGLQLSTTVEYLKKGTYTVDDSNSIGGIVILDCLDNMYKFDTPFSEVNISFPCTPLQLLQAVCLHCQVPLQTISFTNSNYIINQKPNDGATTCREIVSYIAQLSGNFARINMDGSLELKWYDMSSFEQSDNLDGGVFDNDAPYSTGDHIDGGDFTFTETEHYDGGTFKQMDRYHHIYALNQSTIGTDDVVITGIQVENTASSEDKYSVLFGSQGYVLSISNNPLVQSKVDATTIANTVGAKIVGMKFRPFSADILSDPSVEAGDPCYVSIRTGRGYNTYQSFVTSLSYTVSENQSIECNAETPSRKQSVRFNASTKTIVEARKQAKQELSKYDLEQQRFNDLVFHSFGLYRTEEVLEDGSTIEYAHDKPTLAESVNIWRQSADAFVVSNDGGVNWKGMDSDGNIIANVLSAVGVDAEWIKANTLLIGGSGGIGNIVVENGSITIKDANNSAIVTPNGLKVMYIFTSSGELDGWQSVGIWSTSYSTEYRITSLSVHIPEDIIIDTAYLHTRSMPSHWIGDPNVPDGFYHARNLRLYSGNASKGALVYPYTSEYHIAWRQNDVDITNTAWGSAWTPTGEDIVTKVGDVKNYLTTGTGTVFTVQTTDTASPTNARYMGAMQLELVITGFLKG